MQQTRWISVIQAELAPFDGRLSTAWRVAATCALTVMLFMTYGIPLAAIGCYLVLFVMKPNPAETLLMALGICVLVGLMLVVLFGITRLTIEYPVWRMAMLVGASVLFMFLAVASALGPAGSIIALVIVFVLTLLGEVPTGELATRAILYAGLMSIVPMGTLLVFNAFFGLRVPARLCLALAGRLEAVAAALDGARGDALALLHEGDGDLQKMVLFIRLFHVLPKAERQALEQAVQSSGRLLLAAVALDASADAGAQAGAGDLRSVLAARSRDVARRLRADQGRSFRTAGRAGAGAAPSTPAGPDPLATLSVLLHRFPWGAGEVKQTDSPLAPQGFFLPDAWRNPLYVRYALKTTLAALVCYWIYTVIHWQDIHTALITCYVGALGTTAETLHKLVLRITGCLIGAAIGVVSIYFFVPQMTSIGQLMVLVFIVILGAAWVSTGSERSAYAGVQIGLAFLLTILQGFGPDVSMSAALDRVMGILLGNIVLYWVFTRIWPVSAVVAVRRHLQQLLASLEPSAARPQGPDAAQLQGDAPYALQRLGQARAQLDLMVFEPAHTRVTAAQGQALRLMMDELQDFYVGAAFPGRSVDAGKRQVMVRKLQTLLGDT